MKRSKRFRSEYMFRLELLLASVAQLQAENDKLAKRVRRLRRSLVKREK
jgi:hypothetical protein